MSDKSDLFEYAGCALVILSIGGCCALQSYGKKLEAEATKIQAEAAAKTQVVKAEKP